MSQPTRGYMQAIEVEADPGLAWRAFTEEPWLRRWLALDAVVEPRRAGAWRVRLRDGRLRDATIDVWDPPRRLRLIYFPEPDLARPGEAGGAGPVVEDVVFDARPPKTVVRVLGSGVPDAREWDAYHARLRLGWAYWLAALKRELETVARARDEEPE